MKRINIVVLLVVCTGLMLSCKDQLDVKNPNQPSTSAANTESGIIALAQGGVYINGFKELKYYDGVPGYFWSGAIGFHELMGDVVGEEAANIFANQLGCPDYVVLDDGSKVLNPSNPNEQKAFIRQNNVNANAGQNPLYYEWAYMYSLNTIGSNLLSAVEKVAFTGDAETKKNTIKAWAYWWKGFAYSRIGSMYYAGLINNDAGLINNQGSGTNGNYMTKEAVIAEANANLDQAATLLNNLSGADYTDVLGRLIPSFNQVGKGGVLTPEMWKRSINTLKARNLLVNTRVKTMTAEQWNQILALTNDGIKADDFVFTGRANENGDFISANSGSAAAKSTGLPGTTTYKISERLIQDFKTGDKRLENNFARLTNTWIGEPARGNVFNTRYQLLDGGDAETSPGLPGVIVLSNRNIGEYELYLASTYEENELMKAEAKIYTGDIEGGLQLIDAVRAYQGAGLAAVAGTGLLLDAAKEELRRERRVGLVFRALSFYDARRWGVLDDVSIGGGRKNAVVVDRSGKVNTNATINYNFLDYWDVPDNELVYNPSVAGSAPVVNPQ